MINVVLASKESQNLLQFSNFCNLNEIIRHIHSVLLWDEGRKYAIIHFKQSLRFSYTCNLKDESSLLMLLIWYTMVYFLNRSAPRLWDM